MYRSYMSLGERTSKDQHVFLQSLFESVHLASRPESSCKTQTHRMAAAATTTAATAAATTPTAATAAATTAATATAAASAPAATAAATTAATTTAAAAPAATAAVAKTTTTAAATTTATTTTAAAATTTATPSTGVYVSTSFFGQRFGTNLVWQDVLREIVVANCMSKICPPPKRILWLYNRWQHLYDIIKASVSPTVEFIHGIPLDLEQDSFVLPGTRNLVILDDLMSTAAKDTRINELFTEGSHHRNLSVVAINQNLYYNKDPTQRRNCHYLVLFNNPLDRQQVMTLARQMYPENPQYLPRYFKMLLPNPMDTRWLTWRQLHPTSAYAHWRLGSNKTARSREFVSLSEKYFYRSDLPRVGSFKLPIHHGELAFSTHRTYRRYAFLWRLWSGLWKRPRPSKTCVKMVSRKRRKKKWCSHNRGGWVKCHPFQTREEGKWWQRTRSLNFLWRRPKKRWFFLSFGYKCSK